MTDRAWNTSCWQSQFNESNISDLSGPNATNSVKFTIGEQEWTWRYTSLNPFKRFHDVRQPEQ
jgi:hypothetical protein